MKLNKKAVGKAAIIITALTMLTGTFAWNSFSQRAFNAAWEDGNYGGRIRDEYDGEGSGYHNKDVFAENFGRRNIFVRVRLSEFLALDGEGVLGMNRNDVSTWAVYCSEDNDVFTPRIDYDIAILHGEEDGEYGISWTLGHNGAKYFMPTHNHATHRGTEVNPVVPQLFADVDAFSFSEATGRGVDAIASMNMIDTQDLGNSRDLFGLTAEHARYFYELGYRTGPGDGTHDWARRVGTHFAPLIITLPQSDNTVEVTVAQTLAQANLTEDAVEGVDFEWVPQYAYVYDVDGERVVDADDEYVREPIMIEVEGVEVQATMLYVAHTAQRTLEPDLYVNPESDMDEEEFAELVEDVLGLTDLAAFRGVMTLTQFEALGRPLGNFWILDNTQLDCGWFYWNGWLPPGEATSLLLDAIDLPARNVDWEHIIHVEADFFTQETLSNAETAEHFANMPEFLFEMFMGLDPRWRPDAPAATEPEPTDPTEPVDSRTLVTPRALSNPGAITFGGVNFENAVTFSIGAPQSGDVQTHTRAASYVVFVDGVSVYSFTSDADTAVSARIFDLAALALEPGTYEIQIQAVAADGQMSADGYEVLSSELSEVLVVTIAE